MGAPTKNKLTLEFYWMMVDLSSGRVPSRLGGFRFQHQMPKTFFRFIAIFISTFLKITPNTNIDQSNSATSQQWREAKSRNRKCPREGQAGPRTADVTGKAVSHVTWVIRHPSSGGGVYHPFFSWIWTSFWKDCWARVRLYEDWKIKWNRVAVTYVFQRFYSFAFELFGHTYLLK